MAVAGVQGVGDGCLGFVRGAMGVSWWGLMGVGESGGCLHLPDLKWLVWDVEVPGEGPNSPRSPARVCRSRCAA